MMDAIDYALGQHLRRIDALGMCEEYSDVLYEEYLSEAKKTGKFDGLNEEQAAALNNRIIAKADRDAEAAMGL